MERPALDDREGEAESEGPGRGTRIVELVERDHREKQPHTPWHREVSQTCKPAA